MHVLQEPSHGIGPALRNEAGFVTSHHEFGIS